MFESKSESLSNGVEVVNYGTSRTLKRDDDGSFDRDEKAAAALRNHSEAERRRRARINSHFDTLRGLIPSTKKMDKASVLTRVVNRLQELRSDAAEAHKHHFIPMDTDEVIVEHEGGLDGPNMLKASLCCDYRPGLLSNLRQALDSLHVIILRAEIATLGGRMKTVLLITRCKAEVGNDMFCQFLANSVRQALISIINEFCDTADLSLESVHSNKRSRMSMLHF